MDQRLAGIDPQLLAEIEEDAAPQRSVGWTTRSVAPSGTARRVWHIKPGWVKSLEREGRVEFTATPTKQTPWWEQSRYDLAPASEAELDSRKP